MKEGLKVHRADLRNDHQQQTPEDQTFQDILHPLYSVRRTAAQSHGFNQVLKDVNQKLYHYSYY